VRRAALALLFAAACGRAPSDDACAKLFDHFLDVEGDAAISGKFVEVTPPMAAAMEQEKARFRAAKGRAFVDECTRELSASQVECAMSASSEAGMDDCAQ
jgi:hypothetical protein